MYKSLELLNCPKLVNCKKLNEQKYCDNIKLYGIIDIEYNKRLDSQRPCLEDELNGGSNNIEQSNKSV